MALALNKIIITGLNTNNAGAYLQSTTVTALASASGNTAVPAGMYLLVPAANVSVQAYDGSNWQTIIAANVGGTLFSDGQNVRFSNSGANATVTLLTVNGGNAATGQYNS